MSEDYIFLVFLVFFAAISIVASFAIVGLPQQGIYCDLLNSPISCNPYAMTFVIFVGAVVLWVFGS